MTEQKQKAERLINPIEEYLSDTKNTASKFSELFKGNDDFIDQMSEVTDRDICNMTTLTENDIYLAGFGIGVKEPIFASYMQKFLRLRVSRERKSREEYVEVHQAENMKERQQFGMPQGRLK